MGTPGLTGGSLSLFTRYETSFQGVFWATSYLLLYIWKVGQIIFWDLNQVFRRAKASLHKDTNSGLWNSVTQPQQGLKTYCLTHSIQNHQRSTWIVLFSLKKKTILGDFLRKWQIISLFWFVCMYVCVCASVCVEVWLWKHFQRWNIKALWAKSVVLECLRSLR